MSVLVGSILLALRRRVWIFVVSEQERDRLVILTAIKRNIGS